MATMVQHPNVQAPHALAEGMEPSPPSEVEQQQQQAALMQAYQQFLQATGREGSQMTQEEHVKTFTEEFWNTRQQHARRQESQQTEGTPVRGREVVSSLGTVTDTSAAGLTSAESTSAATITEKPQEKGAAQTDVTDTQANTVPIEQDRFGKYQPSVVDAKADGAVGAETNSAAETGKADHIAPSPASQAATGVTNATLPESVQPGEGVRIKAQPAIATGAEQTAGVPFQSTPAPTQNTSAPRRALDEGTAKAADDTGFTGGKSPMSIKKLQDLLKKFEETTSAQQSEIQSLRQENHTLQSTIEQRLKEQSESHMGQFENLMTGFQAQMDSKFTEMQSSLTSTIQELTKKNEEQAMEIKELRGRWDALGAKSAEGKTDATEVGATQTAEAGTALPEQPKLARQAKVETTQDGPTDPFTETNNAYSQAPRNIPMVYVLPIDKSTRFSPLESEATCEPYRSYGLPRHPRLGALPSAFRYPRSANPYSARRSTIPLSSFADPYSHQPQPVFSRSLTEHRTGIPFTDAASAHRWLTDELNHRMDEALRRGTPGDFTLVSEITLPDGSKFTGSLAHEGPSESYYRR